MRRHNNQLTLAALLSLMIGPAFGAGYDNGYAASLGQGLGLAPIVPQVTHQGVAAKPGVQIPNALSAEPSVTCGAESVSIDVPTTREFTGRIFVKGYSQDSSCSLNGNGAKMHGFSINFDQCGLRRNREMNGVTVSATVVVSFHPIFITKADRAYKLNCFYMESKKTVNQNLEVSAITTKSLDRQASVPVCKYEILTDGPYGSPVHYAKIGDQVYHKWSCTTDVNDVYCMKVHLCTVNDGQGGEPVMVLDENGCEIDSYVLQSLDYQADLVAGQSAYVFKFADKPTLHFNCQIELSLKDRQAGCAYSRPQCPPADEYGAKPGGASAEQRPTKTPFPRPPTPGMPGFGSYEATPLPQTGKAGPYQTEVTPSSFSGEYGSSEEGFRGAPPGVAPSAGYKPPTGAAKSTAARMGYKKLVKRDDTNKIADFDLPEQQLVVIEIDEDERSSDPWLRRQQLQRQPNKVCLSSTILAGLFAGCALLCGMIATFLFAALQKHREAIKGAAFKF